MPDEILSTVDAGQAGSVDQQPNGQQEQETAQVEQPVNAGDPGAASQKPVQDPQTNSHFAEMRRGKEAAETKAAKLERDYSVAMEYGQYGIYTEEDLQHAIAEQEAEKKGVDPQQYEQYMKDQSELQTLRMEKQETAIKADKNLGHFYKQWEGEIKTISKNANCDLNVAFNYILQKKMPEVVEYIKSQSQQDAIQKITTNAKASPGALGGEGGQPQSTRIKDMSNTDFSDLVEKVKRGDVKNL